MNLTVWDILAYLVTSLRLWPGLALGIASIYLAFRGRGEAAICCLVTGWYGTLAAAVLTFAEGWISLCTRTCGWFSMANVRAATAALLIPMAALSAIAAVRIPWRILIGLFPWPGIPVMAAWAAALIGIFGSSYLLVTPPTSVRALLP